MSLLGRAPEEKPQEGPRQPMIVDVEFVGKRSPAFLLCQDGTWEGAEQILDCLKNAGLGDAASLKLQSLNGSDKLSVIIEVQDADGSLGALFEKTGQVFKVLEKEKLIQGIEMW